MIHKAWCSIEEVPYCFPRSSIKFQGHTGWKINDLIQFDITRPVAAIKSLRFVLLWKEFIVHFNPPYTTTEWICVVELETADGLALPYI